ncbi:glycoside hydrolase family 2 sugar binding protein [Russula earlei]|uniref:Glycoside hydrolase family 2 sugar binding protein n=1 Tax=Russula earlei TaxID=71964 RepID=A0ACC0TT53_9AGAM|nr:glycoside hydrolase family 2 sugar binding protein [Russula earlei]
MLRLSGNSLITVLIVLCVVNAALAQEYRKGRMLFDDHWRFHRGAAQDAEHSGFNDSSWRVLNLPHDWSIEDLPGTHSPFDLNAISQVSGGFTVGGTGWYRKHFTVDSTQKGKRFVLAFDGVYMNAEVWLNGKSVSKHPYGYTSFQADITDRLKYGQDNIISVKVRNEGENSRWYSGSGIYRHVWLTITEPVHLAQWGVAVSTTSLDTAAARLQVMTKVTNESTQAQQIHLSTHIIDKQGKEQVSMESIKEIAPGASFLFNQDLQVNHPVAWNLATAYLYRVVSEVYIGTQLVDRQETTTGIRLISFDAVNGFRLNGETVKLKGGCVHHDNGPLGAVAYDRAEERKVELLKAAGYNAVRCAHNPPSPAFLDACDRLGMLVIDEAFDCWEGGKNQLDYHIWFKEWWQKDLESMVLRDRNHPSVIMWSTGNEIPNRDKPEVVAVAKKLSDYIRSLDTTRAITCGVNGIEENKDPFIATLDVAGYNYALAQYEPDHKRLPNRVVFATESFPSQSFEYWMGVADHPWVIGDFVWTAWDYIGEASIGWLGYPQKQDFYPWNLAYCGDIDVCGWKRPQSYYRDALWKPNQLSLFVKPPRPSFDTATHKEDWSHWDYDDLVNHWNFAGQENKPLQVVVYSSCDEVELFLNNKSLGTKPTNRSTKFMAIFEVPYQAGELKAIGRSPLLRSYRALYTASQPAELRLTADRTTIQANGQDLSYITVEVADKNGPTVPNAENLVHFSIKGPGSIIGVGNANPRSVESCQLPERKAWHGKCLAIIKSDKKAGDITITATAAGLSPASLIIQSK